MPNDKTNTSSPKPSEAAAIDAAAETDQEPAGEEARISPVSWDEVKKMLPGRMDQNNLDQLITIVNGATDHNEKVAALISNIERLADVVVKAVSRFRQTSLQSARSQTGCDPRIHEDHRTWRFELRTATFGKNWDYGVRNGYGFGLPARRRSNQGTMTSHRHFLRPLSFPASSRDAVPQR